MCGFAFAGGFGVWSVVLPAIFCTTCMGVVLPNASVGALSRHAANAGSASAVMGMLQFLLAAISGTLVGLLTDGTARPMAALMLVGAACATLADRLRAKDPIR
jgi:DHA1 family bicyclomycin/chloramphenicol resistance-like MFS transporter